MSKDLTIPPLISGGVMLSYRCSSACRHCLYRCSPRMPNEWLTLDMAERIFNALVDESSLQSIHLAGGEPGLKFELLEEIIRMAVRMEIPLSYVETNAAWCTDRDSTLEKMERLVGAGLPAILVSVSMFHSEFVPFERTRICVEAAEEMFGPNVIVYMPHMYDLLSRMPDDKTHTLEEFCRYLGIDPESEQVPGLYHVIPGGRAPEALRNCYTPYPASRYRNQNCRSELLSTSHFHIDHHGNLFTGLCAGIVAGTVEDLHPDISGKEYPVFTTLCKRGPRGLLEIAERDHGLIENPDGYVSKCDLCYQVRRHLHATGEFPELRPDAFYTVD